MYLELKKNSEYMFICLSKEVIGTGFFINSERVNNEIFYFWEACAHNCLECNGIEDYNCIKCDEENYFQLYEDILLDSNFKCYNKNEKQNYNKYKNNHLW